MTAPTHGSPAPAPRVHTALSEDPLSLDAAAAFVADRRAGATVTFTGVVRDHARDGAGGGAEGTATTDDGPVRPVTGLDYEAYAELAEQRMAELAAQTAERWPALCAIWAVHRVGRLGVGDAAVVVSVSSPHRHTAFDAGRHLIDELKATVPIWKQEHWADGGTHWPGTD